MNPPAVCHISTLTRWGGVERMLVDFLLHAKHKHIKHTLISISSDPDIIEVVRKGGIPCYQPVSRFRSRYGPDILLAMAKWLKLQQVQIVHSHNSFANIGANLATILAGTPSLITHEHGTAWRVLPPISWLDRWAHQRSKLVLANSQASAKMLGIRYGLPAEKIRLVRNAVPDVLQTDTKQVRADLGIDENSLVVGSVGRLNTPKDYATFIETADLVLRKRQDVIFVLVGDGPLERELRAYVTSLGIQDRFLMTGSRPDARALIQVFDIFVSTSIQEPFGNVLIEASLCEKPVIAPQVDGIPEAVDHEQTGILLRPNKPSRQYHLPGAARLPKQVFVDGKLTTPCSLDPKVLAETILRLIDDPELRRQYGKQGRDRAKRLFSVDRYANDLESIYLDIAGAKKQDALSR